MSANTLHGQAGYTTSAGYPFSETQGQWVGSGERAGRKFSSFCSPDPTNCPWVSEDAGYLTYLGSPPPCKRALRGPKSALACLLVGMLEWQKSFLRGLDITKDVADGMISFVNPVVLVVWCRRFYLFIFFSFILSFIIIIIIIIPFSSFAFELDGEARVIDREIDNDVILYLQLMEHLSVSYSWAHDAAVPLEHTRRSTTITFRWRLKSG